MILECSQCRTRYLVPDSAIGTEGRTVRCASCKHSWFQAPEVLDLTTKTSAAAPAPAAKPIPSYPAAEPKPAPTPRVFSDESAAAAPAPEYDPFAPEPPFKPRRNPAKRWTAAAFVAGISMFIGLAAILYSGAPGLASQFGLGNFDADTPLRFTDKNVERRSPPMGGSDLFAVSGKIVNPTDTKQHVPDIRIELTDSHGEVVDTWRITPEVRTLDPKGAIDFNSAHLNVPASVRMVGFSFTTEIGG